MPQPLIDVIRPDVDAVVALYEAAPDEIQTAANERVAARLPSTRAQAEGSSPKSSDAAKSHSILSTLNPEL
jgi:hypothetical protein